MYKLIIIINYVVFIGSALNFSSSVYHEVQGNV